MSITGALSNALSGLTASGKAAQVVSSNLANAMTEGFARRELSLSAQNFGAASGVRVNGVMRVVDEQVVADRRLADADSGHAERVLDFYTRLEELTGLPGEDGSLSDRVAAFQSGLITAASRPDSHDRLRAAADRAVEMVNTFQQMSAGIQDLRQQADRDIGAMVDRVNTLLGQVQDLNQRVTGALNTGGDPAALLDERQKVIDALSSFIPIRQVPRDRGAVALFSTGGSILLDGTAATLGFQRTNVIEPHMTVGGGHLSGLTVNGVPVRTDSDSGPLRGGALAAAFEIRDEHSIAAQSQLDAVARDLIERFQSPSVDPSLGIGDAGLFTDGGVAFDPVNETGLAGRLALNAAVDPAAGGEVWRLRDGILAASPGDSGNGALLQNMVNVMDLRRVPTSGDYGGGNQTLGTLVGSHLSGIGSSRLTAEREQSFAAARLDSLTAMQLEDGVDSDEEMQKLLLIEQAYSANAKMIQTIDEMIQTLLRLGA
ncbi:flagellar hook-associated protein FlgK [Shimia biformata]|uniref:flagellar hook-associated protein FlgK n=1 Tax=Shimia biformata TaxID=1294299 RepID=UPI001950E8AB|nr:flagellar hook-associated protein FlgK [Shimia biformata]